MGKKCAPADELGSFSVDEHVKPGEPRLTASSTTGDDRALHARRPVVREPAMRRASRTRRAPAIVIGACATAVVIASTSAGTVDCTTHQCDVSNVTVGLGPDGGVVGTGEAFETDGTSVFWESNPARPPPGQTWTLFNGNEYLTFLLPPDAGIPASATLLNYWSYDSAQPDAQVNNVNNSGQLAEYSGASTESITVHNASCQSYYLRVVMQFVVPDARVGEGGAVDPAEGGAVDPAEIANDADGWGVEDAPEADSDRQN
jgi:hypothetical protein